MEKDRPQRKTTDLDSVRERRVSYGVDAGTAVFEEKRWSKDTGDLVGFVIERRIWLEGEWWPLVRMASETSGGTISVSMGVFGKKLRTPYHTTKWADYGEIQEAYGAAWRWAVDASNWEAHTRRYLFGG